MKSKYLLIPFTGLCMLLMSGCKKKNDYSPSGGANGGNPPANTVYMQGNKFSPSSITVSAGTTVTWRNNDNVMHTVTSNTGVFDSGDLEYGERFTHTFNTTGNFLYHCRHHSGMTGTVIVN